LSLIIRILVILNLS